MIDEEVNTRFVEKNRDEYQNPAPGTVIEDGLVEHATTSGSFDFFLIANKATVATARPVHFYVVQNLQRLSRSLFEEFTYHMCYGYFNFMGPIKIPSAVMLARKIAKYTLEVTTPSEVLAKKPHFI